MTIRVLNRGQQLLVSYVKKHGDLRALASRVGINERTLGAYWRGSRKPITAQREQLRVALRIPLLSWDEPVESEQKGAA